MLRGYVNLTERKDVRGKMLSGFGLFMEAMMGKGWMSRTLLMQRIWKDAKVRIPSRWWTIVYEGLGCRYPLLSKNSVAGAMDWRFSWDCTSWAFRPRKRTAVPAARWRGSISDGGERGARRRGRARWIGKEERDVKKERKMRWKWMLGEEEGVDGRCVGSGRGCYGRRLGGSLGLERKRKERMWIWRKSNGAEGVEAVEQKMKGKRYRRLTRSERKSEEEGVRCTSKRTRSYGWGGEEGVDYRKRQKVKVDGRGNRFWRCRHRNRMLHEQVGEVDYSEGSRTQSEWRSLVRRYHFLLRTLISNPILPLDLLQLPTRPTATLLLLLRKQKRHTLRTFRRPSCLGSPSRACP
jgi:hypothetical protein